MQKRKRCVYLDAEGTTLIDETEVANEIIQADGIKNIRVLDGLLPNSLFKPTPLPAGNICAKLLPKVGRRLMRKLNFTSRLALGITALSLLGLATMYIVVNTIVHDVIYDNVVSIAQRDQMLRAAEIDNWFGNIGQSVHSIATVLSSLPDEELFTTIAESFVDDYDFIQNIFIGFADERLKNGMRWSAPPSWTSTDRPWFRAALGAGVGNIGATSPYWSYANENIAVAMATWLPELSGVGATVGAAVSIDFVTDVITDHPILGLGYQVLIGPEGEIIVHPNPARNPGPDVMGYVDELHKGPYVRAALATGELITIFEDRVHGLSYLIITPIESVNWTLLAIIPVAATQGLVVQHLAPILLVLAGILLILFTFTMVIVFFLTRNMEEKHVADMQRQRAEAAEDTSQAMTRFLARMSHEVRTPITAVLGISEIQLRSTDNSPHIEEAFAKIFDSANILLGIVNDILDLSKIGVGKMSIHNEEYETTSMIGDASQLHLAFVGDKPIKFTMHVDENLPAFLVGDSLRIRQVINNLLSNAFKYTEAGTVTFSVEWNGKLILSICDTGYGMSQSQVKALYDEYTRFHVQETPFVSGTGLGMPIVYSLADMMGATIDIESEVGEGTSVVVKIPQQIGKPGLLGPEAARGLENFETTYWLPSRKFEFTPDPMPHGRVLVVDDVEANLYVAKGLLGFYSLSVETCESGFAAIDKVKAGKVYDIIFMDQMMPGMNGTEATQKLREMGYSRPIVALTANALIGQAEEFMRMGFDGFISKPIQTGHLNAVLVKFIRDNIKGAEPDGNYLNQPEVSEKLRSEFAKNQKNTSAELEQAQAAGDVKTAHRLAHTLKGLSLMIGEDKLAGLAEQAERTLASDQWPDFGGLKEELARCLQLVSSTNHGTNQLKSEVSLLDKLEALLEDNDSECLGLLDELAKIPETKILVRQIEEFEFEHALITLGTLKDILPELQ